MFKRGAVATLMFGAAAWIAGCNNSVTGGAELAPLVDAKATDVAERIGGSDGFLARIFLWEKESLTL